MRKAIPGLQILFFLNMLHVWHMGCIKWLKQFVISTQWFLKAPKRIQIFKKITGDLSLTQSPVGEPG